MIETSISMLERMRTQPAAGWEQFVRLYTPLLVEWSRRAGVPDFEVGAFVPDVISHVWTQWSRFEFDPAKGRFRDWLRRVTVNRWRESCRRLRPELADLSQLNDVPSREAEQFWEHEYRVRLVSRAMTVLQSDFQPQTWTSFLRVAVNGEPVASVAADLGMSVGAIHTAKVRILNRLRQELAGLLD